MIIWCCQICKYKWWLLPDCYLSKGFKFRVKPRLHSEILDTAAACMETLLPMYLLIACYKTEMRKRCFISRTNKTDWHFTRAFHLLYLTSQGSLTKICIGFSLYTVPSTVMWNKYVCLCTCDWNMTIIFSSQFSSFSPNWQFQHISQVITFFLRVELFWSFCIPLQQTSPIPHLLQAAHKLTEIWKH